jgi:hypothetical protein
MMGGDSVTDSSDSFDEFLYRAYESGVGEPEYEADLAQAEAIRPELVTSILAQARRESPRILAERIVAAGDQAGWSAEDLAYEAVNEERVARQFLSVGGDPRQLSPRGLAHLLWTAGLEPAQWRELLAQAVAGFVVGAGGIQGGGVWGRTSGLAGDQRADALLGGGEAERDPVAIGRVAGEYVEEVVEAWMSLRRRVGGGPPLSG